MRKSVLPGVSLLIGLGVAARAVSSVVPTSALILAVLLGVVVGNAYGVPRWATTGVETNTLWLETGIVLMGASVALDRVIASGPTIVAAVVVTVLATILTVETLARNVFCIREEVGSLLAAGSGICGVSAVVATAGSIEADEAQIAYAATVVVLFDAVTLLVYPAFGHLLGLSDRVFGMWAGLTMFSTGPVTAAGFAFSPTAGDWALLVKLTRNALIGVAAVGYAAYYTRWSDGETTPEDGSDRWSTLWQSFPKFVLGFLAVMVVANAGMLAQDDLAALERVADWLFLLAFAGLGLDIQLDELRSVGSTPVIVVLVTLVSVSALWLLVLTARL